MLKKLFTAHMREHMLWRLGAIWYTHFTQGLHLTLPFVISVYMVRQFLTLKAGGETDISEEEVGFKTGILGASFSFAQTLTSYILGKVSDRVGRKPVIVLGNISCCLGVLGFGLSKTFVQACLVRLLMGATNGIIGAEKAMIGESLSREEQTQGMKYISLTWGLGALLGPMMGGMFSNVCDGVASSGPCSEGGIFQQNPFLLPCIIASGLSLVAVLLTAFCLEESLPSKKQPNAREYQIVATRDEVEMSALVDTKNDVSRLRNGDTISASLYKKNSDLYKYDREVSIDIGEIKAGVMSPPEDGNDGQVPWYKQKNVLLALSGYALIAFCYIIMDELVPIFASAPVSEGGLAFSTKKLSGPLSFGGVVLIIWMLVGYSWVSTRCGVVRTCIYGLIQTIPTALMFPSSSLSFLNTDIMLWLGMTAKSIAGSNSFTSCLVLVNLASPKESLGEVNGLGQTLASAVRALGPFLGGIMWAGSIRLFSNRWGHQFVPFLLPVLIAICCIFIYAKLRIPDTH